MAEAAPEESALGLGVAGRVVHLLSGNAGGGSTANTEAAPSTACAPTSAAPVEINEVAADALRYVKGGPEVVQTRMTVMKLANLDVLNQTFTVKLRIHSRWKCPEDDAEEARKRLGILDVAWVPRWVPLFQIRGTLSRDTISELYYVEEEEDDEVPGDAVSTAQAEVTSISGSSSGLFDATKTFFQGEKKKKTLWIRGRSVRQVAVEDEYRLKAFPFDLQDFAFTLTCENAARLAEIGNGGVLAVNKHEGKPPAVAIDRSGIVLPDFELYSEMNAMYRLRTGAMPPGGSEAESANEAPSKARRLRALKRRLMPQMQAADELDALEIAELSVVIFCERRSFGYLLNYYLIVFLIGTCLFGAWAIHWRESSSRLGFDVTLLLVAVSFKQQVEAMRPPVSYLTLLDWYTLGVLVFILAGFLFHSILGHVTFDCDGPTGVCTPRSGGFGFMGATADDDEAEFMDAMAIIDRVGLIVFVLIWCVGHIAYIVVSLTVRKHYMKDANAANITRLGFAPAAFMPLRADWRDPLPSALVPAQEPLLKPIRNAVIAARRLVDDKETKEVAQEEKAPGAANPTPFEA